MVKSRKEANPFFASLFSLRRDDELERNKVNRPEKSGGQTNKQIDRLEFSTFAVELAGYF